MEWDSKVLSEEQMNEAKVQLDEWIKNETYSITDCLAFVYGLWDECGLASVQEDELYDYIDPKDKYGEPGKYWFEWDEENPLEFVMEME